VIVAGETETFKSNELGLEVFCGSQFFTMTGDALADAPVDVAAIAPAVLEKLRRTVRGVQPVPVEPPARAVALPAGDGAARYCLAALESAVQRMRHCGEGGRNDTLNGEVYGLAQLVHTGGVSEATIRGTMRDAAIAAGLPAGEVDATIRSAMRGGLDAPRSLPERSRPARSAGLVPSGTGHPAIDPETGEITAANDNNAVDWFSPFPDINTKGSPISTIENLAEAVRRLGVTVRYNVIEKETEILIPGEGFSVDNRANASLAWLMSACKRFKMPTEQLGDFLFYLADRNPYNPVARWVLSKPWDGRDRLREFYCTLTAEGEADDMRVWDLKAAMMRRWMISAVAAAFEPQGVSAHGVLVLQGAQYLGKTNWFKSLAPKDLGIIQDGVILRPDDRDSVKQCVSRWLVELGELDATFRRSDIAALKAFLTRDRDVLRKPYAKLDSTFARRTVFFASVNPREFLHDPTGNRRYWTISCTGIDHQHGLDMQQVWAEVYAEHYAKGESWYLTADEMGLLNEHNRDHEVLDPIRERLQTRLDWRSDDTTWRWMTATDVMQEIGLERPTRADVTQCGQLLQEMNGGRRRKSHGKVLSHVPPRV
jgi:predicted P-loop ATPase